MDLERTLEHSLPSHSTFYYEDQHDEDVSTNIFALKLDYFTNTSLSSNKDSFGYRSRDRSCSPPPPPPPLSDTEGTQVHHNVFIY